MIPTGKAIAHQNAPEALSLAFGRHPDVAEVEQRLRGLVLADPSPEIGVAPGVGAQDLRLAARRCRPDRFVLLAGIGRDPHGDPGAVGRHSDPAAPRVLTVVAGEVAPDPFL